MKRIGILGVCALLSLGAMAQESLLKEAKKAKTYQEAIKIITPAFSDPATANNPETYFIPGKAAVEFYKKTETKARTEGNGQMSDKEGLEAAQALLTGYDYLMKAVELDANAAKPGKYKKEVSKLLYDVMDGFNVAAIYFFNNKEFANAYHSWDIYLTMPDSPLFADNKLMQAKKAMIDDKTLGDLYYNQGISAYQAQNYDDAIAALKKAIAVGNDAKLNYDYILYSAINLKDNAKIADAAKLAFDKYGKEDPQYIGQLINIYINEKNYDEALKMIDEAIANFPDVSQYYFIKGVILEQDEVEGDPLPLYNKAIELDPKNDNALFEKGLWLMKQVDVMDNNAPNDATEYAKVKSEQIYPVAKEAIGCLEEAYRIKLDKDDDLRDCTTLLKNAYYYLGMDPDKEIQKLQ